MIDTFLIKRKLNKIPGWQTSQKKIQNIVQEFTYFSFNQANLKYFLLITRRRSGSTCLLDILSCHPQILTDPHTFFNNTKLPVDFDKKQFIYSRKNIRGFKFHTQPDYLERNPNNANLAKQAVQNLKQKGVTLIYLKRDNVLKRAISILAAKSTNRINFRKDKKFISNQPSLKIEPEELLQHIKYCEEQANFDRQVLLGVPHIAVSYEKDLERQEYHQKTLDKICQVLEIDSAHAITRYVKITPKKLSDYILNYDEIAEIISNSPYAKYLE